MSNTIDEKVVQMKFDNKNFEKNVQTTLNTLDKLKSKLNLDGASKGLELVQKTANTLSFASMESSLNSIEKRFSTFGIVGMTIIQNLTNSVIGLASKLANFSIGGIIDGGFKRATNLQNAKFQLQGLLKEEEKVAAVMKDVNYGVEDTAYTLDAAANVASQLAASGIESGELLRNTLRGISGVAAMTNSTYEEIGNIYTRVAGQGRVMAIDLNSLAARGMNAAATLANALGKSEAEVRDMVSKGKISFEIFANAMDEAFGEHAKEANRTMNGAFANIKAALAKIGAEYFEPIIKMDGPLVNLLNTIRTRINEIKADVLPFIKELSTVTGNFINKIASKIKNKTSFSFNPFYEGLEDDGKTKKFNRSMETIREIAKKTGISINDITNNIEVLNSRFLLFNSIKNIGSTLLTVFQSIGKAFKEVFPPNAEDTLFNILAAFNKLTTTLKNKVADNAEKISNTFKGLFSIFAIGIDIVKSIVKAIGNFVSSLSGIPGGILGVTSALGEWIVKIKDAVRKTDVFEKVLLKISEFMGKLVGDTKEFIKHFGSVLGNTIKTVANTIVKAVGRIFSAIGNAIQSGDAAKFMDLFNKGLLALLLNKIRTFINYLMKGGTLFDKLKKTVGSFQQIAKSISGVFDTVRQSLVVWQEQLRVQTLLKIATAIGILALALTVLSDIDREKLENGLSAITVLFIELMATLKILAAGNFIDSSKKMTMAIGLAISISILAGALKKVADIPFTDMIKAVIALGVLMKVMTVAINNIATEGKKTIKGATGIIALGLAIKILASACKDLGSLDLPTLGKGLGAITVLLTELWAFTKFSKSSGPFIKLGASLILIGAALKIMANVVKSLGELRIDQIGVALTAISGILAAVWGFTKFSSKSKHMLTSALALDLIVLAIKGMVKPITELGQLRIDQVGVALTAIVGSLTMFTVVLGILNHMANKQGFVGGINMMFASESVKGLVSTLEKITMAFNELSKLDWGQVIRSLVAIGVTLGLLVASLKVMNKEDPFGLILCALALNVLAHSVATVANVGWQGVIAGVGGLAGVLIILGVGTRLIKPLIPTMFKLAGAIAALSGSFILLGAGVLTIGLGLTMFMASLATAFLGFKLIGWDTIIKGLAGIAGAFIIIGVAAKLMKPIIGSIFSLAGAIAVFSLSVAAMGVGVSLIVSALSTMAAVGKDGAESAGAALKALIKSILELVPEAVKQLGIACVELLKALKNMLPLIGDVLVELIAMLVKVLIQSSGSISLGIVTLIVSALETLNEYAPKIIDLLVDFIITTLNKLSDRLPEIIPAVINFLDKLVGCIMDAFRNLKSDSVLRSAEGLSILLLTMVGVMNILKFMKFDKKQMHSSMLAFLELAGIVAVLGLVLGAMGAFATDPMNAVTSAIGLSVLLLAMTGVLKILSNMGNIDIKNVGLAVLALAAMAAPLALFMLVLRGMSDVKNAIQNAIALSLLAAAMTGLVFLLNIIGESIVGTGVVGIIAGILSLTAMALPLVAFAGILCMMGNLNNAIENTIALTVLASAMTALLIPLTILGAIAIGSMGISAAATAIGIASLAAMALPLLALVGVLQAMSGIPNASENAYALTVMATALTGMLVALSLVAPLLLVADIAIAGLVAIIAGVGVLATAIGALMTNFPQLQEFLNKGLPVLEQIALSIGTMLGNFVNGFMTAGTANLAEIGKRLSEFAINAMPFIIIMQNVSDNVIKGVGHIAAAILALTGANFLDSIVSFFSGGKSFSRLGMELSNFAMLSLPFISIISKVDPAAMEGAHNLADAILALTAGNLLSSITSWITGKADMSEFANSLAPLGEGIKGFVDNLGEFSDEQIPTIKSACEAIKLLAEVSDKLPKIGGIAQAFSGRVDFSGFIEAMPDLGEGIVAFADNLGEFDDPKIKTIKAGCDAIKELANVADELPKMGGVAQFFSGTTDLQKFADSLKDIGKGVREFVAELVKDNVINEKSIDSVYMVTSLLYAISAIKDVNVKDKGKEMEELASCLISMANRLTEMVKSFETITIEDIEKALNIVDMILELANKVVEFNSEPLQEFGDRLNKLGTESIKNFVEALNDKQPRDDAELAIMNIINAVIETIEGKQEELTNSFKTLTLTATEALYNDEIKNKVIESGTNFVAGFANALKDDDDRVFNAAYNLGKRAVAAVNAATDEHSPSKETYKTGKFFVLGLVNGIKAFASKAYDESYSIGNLAKDGLAKAISRVSDIIENGMDTQPTIRPVLDLSDIQNGVGALDSMFTGSSIGVMSNLNAISSGLNSRSQNGGEVVNAINKLRKDLGNISGDTYNINGVTYDNGSEIQEAVGTLVRAARIERRV